MLLDEDPAAVRLPPSPQTQSHAPQHPQHHSNPLTTNASNPAHLPMHLALQNRQRHRLPPPHLRLPLHPQHLPLPTPLLPPIILIPALAHPPDAERKPQPHHQPAQRRRPRVRHPAPRYREIQNRKAGQRSRDRGGEAAGGVGAVGECRE